MTELVFADNFSAVDDAMDQFRAADEVHLEQTAHNTFDDFIEARVGELITTNFLPALFNN